MIFVLPVNKWYSRKWYKYYRNYCLRKFLLTVQFISSKRNNTEIEVDKIQFGFSIVHNFSVVNRPNISWPVSWMFIIFDGQWSNLEIIQKKIENKIWKTKNFYLRYWNTYCWVSNWIKIDDVWWISKIKTLSNWWPVWIGCSYMIISKMKRKNYCMLMNSNIFH